MSYLLATEGHACILSPHPLDWGSGMCFMWGMRADLGGSLSHCGLHDEKPPRVGSSPALIALKINK